MLSVLTALAMLAAATDGSGAEKDKTIHSCGWEIGGWEIGSENGWEIGDTCQGTDGYTWTWDGEKWVPGGYTWNEPGTDGYTWR